MLRRRAQSAARGGLIAAAGRIPPGDRFARWRSPPLWRRGITSSAKEVHAASADQGSRVVWATPLALTKR